jgi:phage-related minor tail protein
LGESGWQQATLNAQSLTDNVTKLRTEWTQFLRTIGEKPAGAVAMVLSGLNQERSILREAKEMRLDVMYKNLTSSQQESFQRSIQSELGKEFKVYGRFTGQAEFDYTNMVRPQDFELARRMLGSYTASAQVQQKIREQIRAQMSGADSGLSELSDEQKTAQQAVDKLNQSLREQVTAAWLLGQGQTHAAETVKFETAAREAYAGDIEKQKRAVEEYQKTLTSLEIIEKRNADAKAKEREQSQAIQSVDQLTRSLDGESKALELTVKGHESAAEEIGDESAVSKAYSGDLETQIVLIDQYSEALKRRDALKKQIADMHKEEKQSVDVIAAMARMYDQIDKMSQASYEAKAALLEQKKQRYIQQNIDRQAIDAWYAEQSQKLEIQWLKSTGNIADGFTAAGLQIKREIQSWSERSYDFTIQMESTIESGLDQMARDFDHWGAHLKDILKELYYEAIKIAFLRPIAQGMAGVFSTVASGITGAIFGAPAATGTPVTTGGVVGPSQVGGINWGASALGNVFQNGAISRFGKGTIVTQPTIFPMRNGTGLMGENGIEAIMPLQRDSAGRLGVAANGGSAGGKVEVHVHNEGGALEVTREEQYLLSDKRIIDVWVTNVKQGGEARRTIQQVSRTQ